VIQNIIKYYIQFFYTLWEKLVAFLVKKGNLDYREVPLTRALVTLNLTRKSEKFWGEKFRHPHNCLFSSTFTSNNAPYSFDFMFVPYLQESIK
jgi:hypothetical protein